MASKKRARVAVRPPPPLMAAPSGVFVKVPLSPELAAALGGHLERGSHLVRLLVELFDSVRTVADACATERAALEVSKKLLRRGR